ncbi:EAL domain-containing protein (putative c-di-GMP-specific phosphodiesterase class I) [Alkalibacillus flavidus]|uniref:EAL domain-containing protein (Putative c-di-GMP-specific phosphodiesterase class I) n=1 Tax=Alkalibacillus flavidus TaxID=546021 RepID=A0ABV2KZ32_9BACI
MGYEALLRSEWIDAPDEVIKSIHDQDMLLQLDRQSIAKAVHQFDQSDVSSGFLFMNVLPSTVSRLDFTTFLHNCVREYHLSPQDVVVELVELEAIKNLEELKQSVRQLKEHGFLISIDDVSKGSSSFRLMIELEPDIIKMDKYFTSQLTYSTLKQQMIESLVSYCQNTKTRFVLEGIEGESQLHVARRLGVECGQGYYLAGPFWLA